jgi:hypothetical protein
VDMEPLNSDEKDLTNAIKVRVSREHDLQRRPCYLDVVEMVPSKVADPRCLSEVLPSRIPDPNFFHPGSRIPDPQQRI